MDYFTKEHYNLRRIEYTLHYIKKTDLAEKYDEETYEKLYKKCLALYLRAEKKCYWYVDPAKELRELEEHINEENISSEERRSRELYKQLFIRANKKRIESGKFFKFDKEFCKLKFEEQQKQIIKLYEQFLPEEIKEKIADMRVLALGYVSGEVKKLLTRYCKQLSHRLRSDKLCANAVTKDAEMRLSSIIGLYFWGVGAIISLEEKNGDIYLNCETHCLIIKNGKITEGQCKPIYPTWREKPDSYFTRVLETELHRCEDKFRLNLLMCNYDELEREDFWYMTIICTDILKITFG